MTQSVEQSGRQSTDRRVSFNRPLASLS